MQPADAGIIRNLKAKYRKRLLRHVVWLLDGENTASAIIKGVTVLDTIRWLKLSWDGVNKNKTRNRFQKCGFSQLENTTEAAQDDAEFEDLLQLLTIEVAAEVEKVLLEPKLIEVLQMLQKVKSFAINSSDVKLTESF